MLFRSLVTPPRHGGPARRLTVAGAALEGVASQVMEHRLGEIGEPYRRGEAARYAMFAKAFTACGAALVGLGARRRHVAALAGAALVLAGSVLQRWTVFKAGFQSARDPKYTVAPQRTRVDARTRGTV